MNHRSEVLVHVRRGQLTESVHHGHIAVVDHNGLIQYSLGDPAYVTFARSTAKLIQAIAVVETGAADRFQFTLEDIALCCASHSGEPEHIRTAANMLSKMHKQWSDLRCGPHEPLHKPTAEAMRSSETKPTPLHNNCSGKHAGMLAVASMLEHDPGVPYDDINHPVQQLLLSTFSHMCDVPVNQLHLGIDGCGVPVYGLPLHHLALAFARMGSGAALTKTRAEACETVIRAMIEHPFYLAGSDRFDTGLIQATKGRIIGKMGAEGVFSGMIPSLKLGFAIKIEDGAERALYPAVVHLLLQMNLLSGEEHNKLAAFHTPDVKNWRGDIVGSITPMYTLHKHTTTNN